MLYWLNDQGNSKVHGSLKLICQSLPASYRLQNFNLPQTEYVSHNNQDQYKWQEMPFWVAHDCSVISTHLWLIRITKFVAPIHLLFYANCGMSACAVHVKSNMYIGSIQNCHITHFLHLITEVSDVVSIYFISHIFISYRRLLFFLFLSM